MQKKNKTKNEKLFQNKERKGKRAQGKTLSVHLRKKKLLTLMLHILPTPLTHTRTHTDTNRARGGGGGRGIISFSHHVKLKHNLNSLR